jgi:hypothetical protein
MRRTRILFAVFFVLIVFSLFELCYAQDFEVEFMLLGNDNNVTYDLKIVFPEGLYEYYSDKSHRLITISEFSGFVTPYVFESVADKLWEVYNNDEDFANSLLSIVHQMDYEETVPIKYPVETIVDGKGDCDLFSIVAASVAKAGGLDVVLLYYEEQTHMNVGIQLSRAPQDARDEVRYVIYDNKQYFVAECTGENWMEGWRVGECPTDLKDVSVEVIPLEGIEQVAPGQASASFTSLESSVLYLDVTPTISLQIADLNLIGQLSPAIENQKVTLYVSSNNSPWMVLDTVTTKSNGYFQYLWESEFSGIISFRASWSGNNQFAGAVSITKNATVIPSFVVDLVLYSIIAGIVGVIAILIMKRTQNEEIQPNYL